MTDEQDSVDRQPQSHVGYLARKWNPAEPVVSPPTSEEQLRKRATLMKVLAIVGCLAGFFYMFIIAGSQDLRMTYGFEYVILLAILCIPLVIHYFILNSISVSLRASAELHGEIDKLRKMLEDRTKQQ